MFKTFLNLNSNTDSHCKALNILNARREKLFGFVILYLLRSHIYGIGNFNEIVKCSLAQLRFTNLDSQQKEKISKKI